MAKQIKLDVFKQTVDVFLGKEEQNAYLEACGDDPFGLEDVLGITSGGNVWFSSEKPDINTIVHECYHLTKHITKWIGIKDEETESYIIGYLVEKIIEIL